MKRDLFEELKEGFQALQDARSRHPISNEAEYQAALLEIEPYFNNNEPEPNTPESDRFEMLVTLIESYEAEHFPIDPPDPVAAMQFRMEQLGISISDYQSSDYLKTEQDIQLYLQACINEGGDNAEFMAKSYANIESAKLKINDPEMNQFCDDLLKSVREMKGEMN